MNRARLLLLMGLLNTVRRWRQEAEKHSLALRLDAVVEKVCETEVRKAPKEVIG